MKKKDNIDYKYIIGVDIETSRVTPDGVSINGYMAEDEETPYDGKQDIQVPFLANTLEMDIETGEFTNSTFRRTIKELIEHLNSISSEDRMRIVYCQNLFYEITFIIRQFKASFVQMDDEEVNAYGLPMVDGIMRNTTDVVYCRLDCCPNIIFRDSLALFNKPLKEMGKDLNKRLKNNKYLKLDYDYNQVRMPWDELNEHDYKYNERDNEVVLMSLYYFLKDRNISMEDCPLTSTADTKRARKEYIVKNHTEKHLKQINRNKQYIVNTYRFYSLLRGSYQGGFTGSNYKYIDKLVKDVYSLDIKSSYPYQMVNNIFPVFHEDTTSHFLDDEAQEFYFTFLHGITHDKLQKVNNISKVKGYYAVVEFEKVKIRDDRYLLDLSVEHCLKHDYTDFNNKMVKINGKIKEADNIGVLMNNVDLDRFLMLYDYENLIVHELWTTTMSRRLPEGEVGFILNNFSIKESIDKNKEPIQYALAKIRINAMYGVKVQNEVKDSINIINGEIKPTEFTRLENDERKQEVYENTIGKGNKGSGFKGFNFDIYSDGVYITSFARSMLMAMMVKLTEADFDVIYSDTDSLKFKSNKTKHKNTNKKTNKKDTKSDNLSVHDKVKKLINDVNNKIINSNMKNIRVQQFLKNNTNYNEKKIYKLGTWEIESVDKNKEIKPYAYFKTLGAKKYAYIDHEGIHTTVAGCRKESFAKAILNYVYNPENGLTGNVITVDTLECMTEKLSKAIDFLFTTGTLVDVTASGRTIARYESRTFEECMELKFEGRLIESAGGVVIVPTTYKLNISKNDALVLGEIERHEMWTKSINIDGHIEYNEEDLEVM
jgi:hypothetical protein